MLACYQKNGNKFLTNNFAENRQYKETSTEALNGKHLNDFTENVYFGHDRGIIKKITQERRLWGICNWLIVSMIRPKILYLKLCWLGATPLIIHKSFVNLHLVEKNLSSYSRELISFEFSRDREKFISKLPIN